MELNLGFFTAACVAQYTKMRRRLAHKPEPTKPHLILLRT